MREKASFTPREVAVLSGAPKRTVEKAIEEGVLRADKQKIAANGTRARRVLPVPAVAYATILSKLEMKLGLVQKRRLLNHLTHTNGSRNGRSRSGRIELSHGIDLNARQLLGDVTRRAEWYRNAREKWIERDEEIKGGTPVIRGTRMTVYSVLGRVDHGDTIDEILEENYDLDREALEVAVIYARAHPFVGRPGGKPWIRAA